MRPENGFQHLVAELNSSGAVVSQFIYARGAHVPDILIKGTTVYQMVTDHLGSVRLVVQMSNGAIAQRIDYDDWGTPTYVTGNADLQPFAFAGGLWDPDTKLLHLGAREYDPEVRRFLTRDPSGFAGGWNLYGYAGNDPINYVDPDGNVPIAPALAGAAAGAGIDIAMQLASNGCNFNCLNWGDVATSAALGAFSLGGRFVGGSMKWSAVRARLGKQWALPPGTPVHHWAIPQGGWGKRVPDWIKNSKWNLMPPPKHARDPLFGRIWHQGVHGQKPYPQSFLGRLQHGSPAWAKGAAAATPTLAGAAAATCN